MSMTLAEIRLKQNPILTSMLLGMGTGARIAEKLFPRLPQVLSNANIAKLGKEHMRQHNLRRSPGGETKMINIKYENVVYTVDQYAVDVPLPREWFREADEARRLNVGMHLELSAIGMNTAKYVLDLGYEIEVAAMAIDPANYAVGNSLALAAGTKWSAATGTPVTDIRTAAEIIRKKAGVRPNTLTLSPDAFLAASMNPEVKGYLPNTTTGPATIEQLKTIFNVKNIEIGDAIWVDENDVGQDVWGNAAILAYVPTIKSGAVTDFSLAEPAFGFTNVIEGHPFAETPYYKDSRKSWIYGATFERRPNTATPEAGFLFLNPK
ncbi:MAG: hypothetical protein A2W72_18060 [Burkholderiales bacterium RIFCSPLOWO2_12_67_14]|nr:MAG: hypothetical protein A3I64_07100 [Burkholderiales bacterium RIFCSPLOWO2_02_FULL_67_64]OGB40005.1 MAG: hypothetical protein A3E51_05385 [Burkholderiales bacterium RIFCSPHIGHO2_12_FULL_67_38]OGB49682.1 MAG: hypothetical protein A2W72_18060 [Burkholderiales bacterium RIFCSPLOWO2_12_67_14]OGB87190.1 MAG: hypothetical protein A3G82_19470 [Burkholderiales bacterium RIFCSPLOWO2_12_FULL_67_210]